MTLQRHSNSGSNVNLLTTRSNGLLQALQTSTSTRKGGCLYPPNRRNSPRSSRSMDHGACICELYVSDFALFLTVP